MRKLNNSIIDEFLKNNNIPIERLDDYRNCRTLMKWKCTRCIDESNNLCGYEWKTTSGSIKIAKSGCPKCSNNAKLTNETVDEKIRLQKRDKIILRIDDVINSSLSMKWLCLVCNGHWLANADSVINCQSGCQKCYEKERQWTDLEIDIKLINDNRLIKRAGNFKSCRLPMKWECINGECHHQWMTRLHDVLSGSGCPRCKLSKGEVEILNTCKFFNVDTITQKTFPACKYIALLRFDVYLPRFNTCIEFQGEQHYKVIRG